MRWLLVLVIAGCQSHSSWSHARPANFDADDYECSRDTRMVGQQALGPRPFVDWDLYVKCMRAHGWTQVED